MVPSAPQAAVRLQKNLSVRRCSTDSELYWWSLPLSLKQFSHVFAADLRGVEAEVFPANALDAMDAALLAVGEDLPEPSGGVAVRVRAAPGVRPATQRGTETLHCGNVTALLELADAGRLAPCRLSLVKPSGTPLFSIQVPKPHVEQPQYCFHRQGDAVRALASLTLGRGFGADPVSTERDLFRHEDFSGSCSRDLQLILENGGARLEAIEDGGRRRLCYLESGRGFRGSSEVRSRLQVWRETWREELRRFPVKVVLFAGLPVFIGFFRAGGALLRRRRP